MLEARGRVPDAVAPPPRHPRFPLIDGLRAVAVLSVLLVHAAGSGGALGESVAGRLLAHLNVGVAIFFVISGFLLYRPFIAWRGAGPEPPRIVDYARRRALRILPAYWLVVTVLVLVPGVTAVVDGEWLQQYALAQWLPLSDGGGCTAALLDCGLAQTWSLGVELSFYAVLPLYVLATAGLARRGSVRWWMRSQLVLLGTLAAISVALAYLQLEPGTRTWVNGTFAGYWLWFALGMGLAVASVALQDRDDPPWAVRAVSARPGAFWLAALAIYTALCLAIPPTAFFLDDEEELAVNVCFGVVAALLVLPAVFGDRQGGFPRRFLANPVVAWLGLISYGIFLWHYVAALELGVDGDHGFAVVLIGTLAISIACAAVSYYVVERPLLRLKYRRPRS